MKNTAIENFANEIVHLTNQLHEIQNQIRAVVSVYSNGRKLKGNELVGWLGEIYVKLLYGGLLADETEEYDVYCNDGKLISVKARKGISTWSRTSGIPRIRGDGIPTHLAFVHLHDNYALDRIWLFPWIDLIKSNRFKQKRVRGNELDYYFTLNENRDLKYLVYENNPQNAIHANRRSAGR
jgi:hypothetical protein